MNAYFFVGTYSKCKGPMWNISELCHFIHGGDPTHWGCFWLLLYSHWLPVGHWLHYNVIKTESSILPVCVRVWILRFSDRANILPQLGNAHKKGFSPVCTRIWLISLYLALKAFPSRTHSFHMQTWLRVSSPVATCSPVTWSTRSCMELKLWLQTNEAIRSNLCLEEIRPVHLQTSSDLTAGPLLVFNKHSFPSLVHLSVEVEILTALLWGSEMMLEAPELLLPSGAMRPLCLVTTATRLILLSLRLSSQISQIDKSHRRRPLIQSPYSC